MFIIICRRIFKDRSSYVIIKKTWGMDQWQINARTIQNPTKVPMFDNM